METIKKIHRPLQKICSIIVENKIFLVFSIFMIFFNLIIITGENDDGKIDNAYDFLIEHEEIFSVYFIFEAIISIIASSKSWKHFNEFWTYFDILIIIINTLSLIGLPNFSAIRLWSIFKYLPRIKWLRGINTIFRALKKSIPVLRDIVIFVIFVFIFTGILGVHMYGGKLKYRCVNEYGMLYDEEQICSNSTSSGYQCPDGYTCTKTDINPYYNTVGFDNIYYSCLTIFQIITMEGWSDILFMTSDSSSYWGFIVYLIVIILGNWFILQLIVAVISNNLMDEMDDEEGGDDDDENEEIDNDKLTIKTENQNDGNEITVKQSKTKKKNIIKKLIYGFVNSKIMLAIRKSAIVNFIQKILRFIMDNNYWDTIMMLIIIADTVSTCLINKDTSNETREKISKISDICTIIFAVEMICKLIMLNPVGYVKQTFFNVMDGTFTILSVIDQFIIPSEQGFFIFRILRSLRVLRVSKYSKQFQYLFEVIKDSSLQLLCLIIIWFMSVLIFATFGYQLFKGQMNFEDGVPDENFDNIASSILSVIQLFTMENWNNIEVSCVHALGEPYVLIPIIISIIGSFFLSNILVAIIIGAFQDKITDDQSNTDNTKIHTLNFLKNKLGGFIDITKEGTGSFSFSTKKRLEKKKSHDTCSVDNNKTQSFIEGAQSPTSPQLTSPLSAPPLSTPSDHILSAPMTMSPMGTSPTLTSQTSASLPPYPLPLQELTERQKLALSDNLRIIETEINKGSQYLINDDEISKLNKEREEIMKKLSEEGGIKGLYYKYRLSECTKFFQKMTDNVYYNIFVTIIIILSCAILYFDIPKREVTVESVKSIPYDDSITKTVYIFNVFFGVFFVFEFIFQAIAQGLFIEKNAYLRDPLNWIDLIVIIISIIGLFEFAENLLILRVFRLLRIIKLIKLSRELRIVTMAIWKTIPSLMTAIIPFMFYLLIATVIGLSLYTGDGYTCNDPNPNITHKDNCTGVFYSSTWDREVDRKMWGYFVGYDNFFDSLQTSFVLSNQEGWPDIMYYFMGYGSDNTIREPGINKWVSVYYITSVVIGSWIFLAVVTGIAYDSIKRNSDILKGINDLNSNQKKIHEYVDLLITQKPYKQMKTPRNKWILKARNFFESPLYDKVVFVILILNIIILILYHDEQTKFEESFQNVSEFIFLVIYTAELICLIVSYGLRYFFNDNWRNLCFVIVLLSYGNLIIAIIDDNELNISNSNVFVSIRLLRMFRLLKFAKGIRALIQVITTKYKQLLNIFILMFIVIITYAFLGCYYFGDINYKNTDILNDHLNFSSFSKSLLSVFIFTTGENWPIAMADCVGRTIRFCSKDKDNCGTYFSPFYFISLQILVNWILLNSFVAIVVDSFVMLLQEHDEINRIELVKKSFSDAWNKYDKQRKGILSFKEFVHMYNDMVIPENFEWSSKKIKFFKTKPPISYLFKNLKVYYNYVTFTDALFCITSFWVHDDLPMNVRNAVWEHNGWNRLIRKKLFILGDKITFSEKDGAVPLKEISFGTIYGIYLLQRKYKKWKSCDCLADSPKKSKKKDDIFENKQNEIENVTRSIKSAKMDDDELNNSSDSNKIQTLNNSESNNNKKMNNDNNDNDNNNNGSKVQSVETVANGSNDQFFDATSNEHVNNSNTGISENND